MAANPYAAPKAVVDDAAEETQPVRIFSVSGRIGRARYIVNLIGWNILFSALIAGLSHLVGPAALALWAGYFILAFMLFDKITPGSLWKELIEDQNTALGVLMGAVAIALAIIIAAAVH